jgi:hypothetical protein
MYVCMYAAMQYAENGVSEHQSSYETISKVLRTMSYACFKVICYNSVRVGN